MVPLATQDREAAAAVTCMALYPPSQSSTMWLLAVAFAGSDGKVKVFDISDIVARIRSGGSESGAAIRVRSHSTPIASLIKVISAPSLAMTSTGRFAHVICSLRPQQSPSIIKEYLEFLCSRQS